MKEALKYIFGILLAIAGVTGFLGGDYLTGLIIIILGVIIFPPVSERIKSKLSLWHNDAVRYVSYIMMFFIAGLFIGVSAVSKSSSNPSVVNDFRGKRKVLVEYIKKDTTDKSIQNIKKLVEVGKLFDNHNSSILHPKDGYISEQMDSVSKRKILVFNPKYDFEDAEVYLKTDPKNGIVKDYVMKFDIDSTGNIMTKKTIITYSRAGKLEYNNDNVPEFSTFINQEIVDNRIEEKRLDEQYEKQQYEHRKRLEKFEKDCLSSYDGSHRGLIRIVKQNMHNPKSFEHIETKYAATNDYAGIVMVYMGTNAFGAIVTNSIKAKVSLEDCTVISIEEQ